MHLFGFTFLLGCSQHVSFEVTKPAQINIPKEIQSIAVINRSPQETSQSVLSVFLSESTQLKNPRFQIREPSTTSMAFRKLNATLGQPLDNNSLVPLCRAVEVDAVVTLETAGATGKWDLTPFTVTETTTEQVIKNGKTESREVLREVTRFRAEYAVVANADWIFYGCKGNVLDRKDIQLSDSWIGEGDTRVEAKEDAGNAADILRDVQNVLGRMYLQRISPYEVNVHRSVYRSRPFKAGIDSLNSGKPKKAQQQFKAIVKTADGKLKGKALHNLAVAEEASGDLNTALEHAQRAVRLTEKKQSLTLRRDLKRRLSESKQIELQLSLKEEASSESAQGKLGQQEESLPKDANEPKTSESSQP